MYNYNMVIPEKYTTVTKISKLFALFLFIALPFIGFYFGIKYQKLQYVSLDFLNETVAKNIGSNISKPSYKIEKSVVETNDPNSFKYDLIRTDIEGEKKVIYTLVNWFGFGYEVSDDDKYIAIDNYGESGGDETLTIIKNDGELVKNFEHSLDAGWLIPIEWTEHYYWLYRDVPVLEPRGVVRVNADTLEVNYYDLRL